VDFLSDPAGITKPRARQNRLQGYREPRIIAGNFRYCYS